MVTSTLAVLVVAVVVAAAAIAFSSDGSIAKAIQVAIRSHIIIFILT